MLVEGSVHAVSNAMVYLVGAGPGDKNLLTLEADRLLKEADVVVYDRLVGQEIMDIIPKTTELINVGKNVGNHAVPQDEINRILLKQASLGKKVVRLKGGDPFLFGRGGEELEMLIDEGIPFKVVPGITSAIAAPSYAGIPVTHRDFCASVHIISGHSAKEGELPIDYEALTRLRGTLVFLMSVASMPIIAKGLISGGMARDTQVAFIENGTRADQRKILTNLENCEKDIKSYNIQSPATIVVGQVCSLSNKYDWFSKQSLNGCKILVTRPDKSIGALSEKLSNQGASVKRLPLIETQMMDFELQLKEVSVVIFTSGVGVEAFFQKLNENRLDSRALYGKRIAVVGAQTEKVLANYGITADFCPKVYSGEALAKEMLESSFLKVDDKVIIYRAKEGSEELIAILQEESIDYVEVPVYKTLSIKAEINPKEYDYITFTSASTVKSFVDSVGKDFDFSKVKGLCIGQQTANAAKEMNIQTFVSKEATIDSMVERVKKLWKQERED